MIAKSGREPAAPSSRDKILDVAEALFAQRGFSGVGMREVADRAGLGKSSLFHHFRTKVQLYNEVALRVLERIHTCLQPTLNSADSSTEKLESWVDALIDGLVDHPTTARLLLRGLFEDEIAESDAQALEVEQTLMSILAGFQELIREGVKDGEFRPLDAGDATQTMIGLTVYHFASGEIGESILAGPIFSADAIDRRKRETRLILRRAFSANADGSDLEETK